MRRALPLAALALVIVAPLVGGALEAMVHAACGALCHQDPARSFAIAGATLPLCARCTGVLVGVVMVALAWDSRALGDLRAWPWLLALGVLDRVVRPVALDHPIERLALGIALGAGLVLGARWALARMRRASWGPTTRAIRRTLLRLASEPRTPCSRLRVVEHRRSGRAEPR